MMRRRFVFQSLAIGSLLFLVVILPSLAAAVDVAKWSTYDVNLTAATTYSNGYASGPTLTATFTGPGGVTKTVNGFWNGGSSFDIRFTPTVEGAWSYTTSSGDSSLNGKTGSINATAPVAGDHGFLRVDRNYKNSFVYDDGTRYFMWGQTYYDIVAHGLVNNTWKTAVDNSASHGINKVILNVYTDFFGGEGNHHGYPDVGPYTGTPGSPDRDSLNLTYWRKLDEVVQYLDSKGLVANLVLTNAYSGNRVFGTDTQNDQLIKYAVSRYAAYTNVSWNLCYEYGGANTGTYPQNQADFNRFGGIVRSADPWLAEGASLRPLSIHQNTAINFQFFAASWPTHAIIQYGPRNVDGHANGDQWGNAGIVYNLGHNVPVVNDEYGYLGDVGGVPMTQTQSRNAIWGIATAGGFGSIGDWRLITDGSTTYRPAESCDWADAPEYDDIKHMVDFFTTKGVEYWKMTSHNELKTAGTRTYVLAEPGRQYVAYAAVGDIFSINLAAGTYYAYRYNPQTGTTTNLGTVTGGTTKSFTMPDGNDWVLHLSTFQEIPEPGTLTLLGFGTAGLAVGWRRWRRSR